MFAPLEVGDPGPVFEQIHAVGSQVVDAKPDRPVPRVEERLDVVGEGLLLLAVAGHRHAAAALQALPGSSSIVLITVVHKITFVSYPSSLLAT